MMGMTSQPAPPLNEASFDTRGPEEQAAAAARRNDKLFMVKIQVCTCGGMACSVGVELNRTSESTTVPPTIGRALDGCAGQARCGGYAGLA